MRREYRGNGVGAKKALHSKISCGVLFSLLQLHYLISVSAENLFYLVLRIINPVSDFIGCILIGNDIGTNKVFDSICTAVCFG